jgi:hypothetical protein
MKVPEPIMCFLHGGAMILGTAIIGLALSYGAKWVFDHVRIEWIFGAGLFVIFVISSYKLGKSLREEAAILKPLKLPPVRSD